MWTSSPVRQALILAFCGLSLACAAQSLPKHKYFSKAPPGTAKYVEQHAIDIGDQPGHQLRVAKLFTKYGEQAPEFDGVKVSEVTSALTSDYVDGSGHFVVYALLTMANGDRIYERGDAITRSAPNEASSRKSTFAQVWTITGGTGNFNALRGTLRTAGGTDFKTGTSDVITEGEYWFDR
jgi:hypothetical protein